MRSVGVGGFARVYHAVDPDLELDVAIKVLRPELAHDAEVVERFRREATTAAKLRHPHVITVLTVGRLTEPFDGIPVGAPYLVMDYLPHSLADRLNAGGALGESEVARVGAEVARGLAYAHRQGIVHRDVKPENVLFARDGRAVVTDFGIARALSAAPSGPSRQVLLGTPSYFSPEQARGLALDGRSDLYSLGVTLYRAATGVVPFSGDDWYVVMRQHIEEIAEPPSSVNRELDSAFDAVLSRVLAKDPAARYPTGDALADALDLLRGAASNRLNTTEIPRVAAEPVAAAGTRRWRWTAAALAALGVAVAGGRLLAVRGSPERVPPEETLTTIPSAVRLDSLATATRAAGPGMRVVNSATLGANGTADSAALGSTAPVGDVRRPVRIPPAVVGEGTGAAVAGTTLVANAPGARVIGRVSAARGAGVAARGGSPGSKPITAGTLSISVPQDADVYLDGEFIARGSWRSGPLALGRYTVRASLGGLPGCASADTATMVDVMPNVRRAVTLEPVPCGRLQLDFTATTPPHYTLVPLRGGPTREGMLPLAQPLVLPDGIYRLTVEASACATYRDESLPVVAGKTRREPHTLICQ